MFLDGLLPTIRFPQNPNLVFRRIPLAFDVWYLSFAPQTNTSHGRNKRGHVTRYDQRMVRRRYVEFGKWCHHVS